jgi:prephenate dehydrogenase
MNAGPTGDLGVRRAAVLGTGLIGGSIAAALRARGADVVGWDHERDRAEQARTRGVISETADSVAKAVIGTDLAFVAVPVGAIAEVAVAALRADASVVVSDVGSVKGTVVRAVEADAGDHVGRFVGGHPMAGSEQDGLDGARAELFQGATWVLTPTDHTHPDAFATVRAAVAAFGAEAIALTPRDHDLFVATVSHVPQLAASTLMDVAIGVGAQHTTLLRLAAGGFRDMTRIAAGNPAIWPDILTGNQDAVLTSLDRYRQALDEIRRMVAEGDRAGLLTMLQRTRNARRSLPVGAAAADELAELHVLVPDRPGVLAEITTLAGRLGVNVFDLEIAHSIEGDRGVMVLVVAADDRCAVFESGLRDLGYAVTIGTFE